MKSSKKVIVKNDALAKILLISQATKFSLCPVLLDWTKQFVHGQKVFSVGQNILPDGQNILVVHGQNVLSYPEGRGTHTSDIPRSSVTRFGNLAITL